MFTGIVETLGKLISVTKDQKNIHFTILCPELVPELQIDQSVSHNGVCLTVVSLTEQTYTVTAIEETLIKTNLGKLQVNDRINLERAMLLSARLDGHMVQGHVDQTAICKSVVSKEGSWVYTFEYDISKENYTVEKGSITVNGVSLTVVDSKQGQFSVAIIPYTYAHTNFNTFKAGTVVNLEFDVIGKYVKRLMQPHL